MTTEKARVYKLSRDPRNRNAYMDKIRKARSEGVEDPEGVPEYVEQDIVTVDAVRAVYKTDKNGDFVLDDNGEPIFEGNKIEKIRVTADVAEDYAIVLAEHKEMNK